MGFLDALRGLFRKKQDDDDMFYSIVMLLRSHFAMSKGVLAAAASKAYGVPYDGSHEMYFVVRDPGLTIVKAGGSVIKVLEAAEPYLGEPAEVAQGFADKRLGSAWIEHHTWVAFDLMNRDVPKKQAYAVLAALVAELLDVRCAGIYLPKETSSPSRVMDRRQSTCGGSWVSFPRPPVSARGILQKEHLASNGIRG